jgi:hypothetical protein
VVAVSQPHRTQRRKNVRRIATAAALIAAAAIPAGVASATTPDTTPPPEAPSATPASEGSTPGAAAAAAPLYDEEGNVIATIAVLGLEPAWTDYAEGDEPDEGREYARVMVSVASETPGDDTFAVAIDDFILQDSHGFVTTAENIRTAAEADAEDEPVGDAELASGESVEFALTFQVGADAGPQSVFYRPDDERLVDVAEFD